MKGRLPFTKLSGNVSAKEKNFFDSVELFEFVEFSKGKSIFAFSAVVHDVKTTVKNMNTEDRERGRSFAWLTESSPRTTLFSPKVTTVEETWRIFHRKFSDPLILHASVLRRSTTRQATDSNSFPCLALLTLYKK